MASTASHMNVAALQLGALRPFTLRARQFYVAWFGVASIIFHAFPRCVARFKRQVLEKTYGWSRDAEGFGSRWPKITLGCLRDGRELTLEELRVLQATCARQDLVVPLERWLCRVEALSVVVFQSRNLERQVLRVDLPLEEDSTAVADDDLDDDSDSAALVDRLVEALDKPETHLSDVNRKGHHEQHYREVHHETTLVAFVGELPECVQRFKQAVDAAVPDAYVWFDDASLHVTIRSLTDVPLPVYD